MVSPEAQERIPAKPFTVHDVARVMVDLGISPTEQTANQQIIQWRRESSMDYNDTVVAALKICLEGAKDLEIRKRFEMQHGVKMTLKNLFLKALGGTDADPDNVNLPRSLEDEKLDVEAKARLEDWLMSL